MHKYELMVILDAAIDERTVAPSLDKFLNVIRNGAGTIDSVDIWGRRRLAYEINKKTEGIYVVVNMHAKFSASSQLRFLRFRPKKQQQRSQYARLLRRLKQRLTSHGR